MKNLGKFNLRIAIPSNDGKNIFKGMLGRSLKFFIFEIDREKNYHLLEERSNRYAQTMQHLKTLDVYDLIDDCSVILSSKIGKKGIEWLEQRNMILIFREGNIRKQISDVLKNEISDLLSKNNNKRIKLTEKNSKINFKAFIWHSVFLALALNFMDVDTIIPSMLIKAGGGSVHLGILTAIMLGGSSLFQLIFAGFLSNRSLKKKYLLIGINLRVAALLFLSLLFFRSASLNNDLLILFIFLFISLFSFSGSFANVSYIDILGKSVLDTKRRKFFSTKQIINSIGIFSSVLIVRELLKYYNYPVNYSILFLFAGILLLIASLGFWKIWEIKSVVKTKERLVKFFTLIPSEIKKNANLKYYLLIINSLGLGLSLLPFLILYAKVNFGLSYGLIGNFLLFRTIGMLSAGLSLYKYSNRFQYKNLLKLSITLAGLLPVVSLVFSHTPSIYQLIYILSGIFVTVFKVAIDGVLMEISTNENRAIYAGISGAGNILTTLFPLFAGVLISILGYHVVFMTVSMIISLSYIFVTKLQCKPAT